MEAKQLVPLKPVGKEDVRNLELGLILAALLNKEVMQQAIATREKLTWLDALIVAAGALAREKAGYPVAQIAEELSRAETTIRNHLAGRTEAGRIVADAYRKLIEAEGDLEKILE